MQQLNLPPVKVNIKLIDGKYHIFDVIRKKFVVLTPEEWVRQHIVHYLLDYHNYGKGLINIEGGFKYNKLNKRSDVLIYDPSGEPYLLIECKSYDVKLNNKVVEQAAIYNKKIRASYIMITNGLKHFCCSFEKEQDKYITCPHIPPAPAK